MVTQIWANIGLGNGSLSDSIKPFIWSNEHFSLVRHAQMKSMDAQSLFDRVQQEYP